MNKKIIFLIVVALLMICIALFYFYKTNNNVSKSENIPQTIVKKTVTQGINFDSLLVQINKQHCQPESYVPKDLVNIFNYGIPADNNFQLRKIAVLDLQEMINQAKIEGVNLKLISAYRSYQDQQRIYKSWVSQLGAEEAARQSAPPGCSQHELGTAVDFNELSGNFAQTPAGIWLAKNAWQYGWVISYPLNSESLTGYVYEPWHYRYIGKENAKELQKSGLILSKFLDTKNNF